MSDSVDRLTELMADARHVELRLAEAKGYLLRDGERRVYGECAVQAKSDPRLAAFASLEAEQLTDQLVKGINAVQRELSDRATAERVRRRRHLRAAS